MSPTSADTARRLGVTAAGLFCLVGTLVGTGVIGTSVAQTSGGSLSADATLIAPAGPAFSIWSVIYLGLFGYVVWQWLPATREDARARATGWFAAASMVLNAAWLLVVQRGWLWVSVTVIVALALVLKVVVTRLTRVPPRAWLDRLVLDGTFGLYLGWVAVATCANIAATLVDAGLAATGVVAEVVTVAVLVLVLALGAVYAARYRARWAVAGAMAWGLGWVAYGRLAEQPPSVLVGVTAAVVAVLVLALTALGRRRAGARHVPRSAGR